MNSFVDSIAFGETKNGAAAHKDTGDILLDFFYHAPTCRNSLDKAVSLFKAAFGRDEVLAMKILFYVRNPRNGSGEKDVFHACLNALRHMSPVWYNKAIVDLIPNHGSWKDVFKIAQKNSDVFDWVANKFVNDTEPSLFWKWIPSINSGTESRKFAQKICRALQISEADYRRKVSAMRSDLPIVETLMSSNQWKDIDYTSVPSVANKKYNGAFIKHDGDRRREFLGKVITGEAKMNAGVLTPTDAWLTDDEAFWVSTSKNFPSLENAIPVVDCSGSMTQAVTSKISALNVAQAMGAMMAQRMNGAFNGIAIPFSSTAKFINVGATLHSAKKEFRRHSEVANTDFQAVFKLILDHAIQNNVLKQDMPKVIVAFSDTEFDKMVNKPNVTAFNALKKKFVDNGYEIPLVVFWNVTGSDQAPVTSREKGAVLLSGFGPKSLSVISGNLPSSPLEAMMSVLNQPWLNDVRL